MLNIRHYQAFDREALIQLWGEVFGYTADYNAPATSLDRKMDFGADLLYVAEVRGEVVGAVMGGYDGHRGWVYSLAVSPSHRRRGIALRLMRHLENRMSELGCPKLNLKVRGTNHEVLRFYESLGYAVEDRISLGKRLGHNSPGEP